MAAASRSEADVTADESTDDRLDRRSELGKRSELVRPPVLLRADRLKDDGPRKPWRDVDGRPTGIARPVCVMTLSTAFCTAGSRRDSRCWMSARESSPPSWYSAISASSPPAGRSGSTQLCRSASMNCRSGWLRDTAGPCSTSARRYRSSASCRSVRNWSSRVLNSACASGSSGKSRGGGRDDRQVAPSRAATAGEGTSLDGTPRSNSGVCVRRPYGRTCLCSSRNDMKR
mmetsp:Transcript_8326/g.29572  ORF Transcript_8326/g.29572 Transcript_8326/m.29572 type:complete len:230 (-) Transcript_8326:333-1022(-)